VVWPEHGAPDVIWPAESQAWAKISIGSALEIFAYEFPPDVTWPVAAQLKNNTSFPPNPPQIHQKIRIYQKDLMKTAQIDENGAYLLVGQWLGVPGRPPDSPQPCPAMPQQAAPPIYV
jgi:hypothetical protein